MSKLWAGTAGTRFVGPCGRQLILRGVNLGGDSKVPYPGGGTERYSDFSDHRDVSFVGRPFPLNEADDHLGRLRRWGFNVLRLVVTWEAVAHAGPDAYDDAYIDYIGAVCERAREHGLMVIVDFHQDVWSRMSGGSGAPAWVFDALGLDFTAFDAAGAAHVMQYRYDYAGSDAIQDDRYPPMSWPLNYQMPVNGILWTAFFAGAALTPSWMVDGENVQNFLWRHYFGAVCALARRLKALPNVIGFDSLNEPGTGWLGLPLSTRSADAPSPLRAHPSWTPLDGLKVARGVSARLPCPVADAQKTRIVAVRELIVNPEGVSIWKPGVDDPFERAGAWTLRGTEAVVLDEDFFRRWQGRVLDVERDCMAPFFAAMARSFRSVREDWLLFAEINPYATSKGRGFPEDMPAASVNASHWYDVRLLWSKHVDVQMPSAERAELQRIYRAQLTYMRGLGDRVGDGLPTLIGEFGTPYDLDHGAAFARWSEGERGQQVWEAQASALSMMYDVMDALHLSSTQWNYTATNSNDLRIGDRWNQEDLSIYSPDQHTAVGDPYSGARAALGFCRAYAPAIQGTLIELRYDWDIGRLELAFDAQAGVDAPTEVFIPPHLGTTLDVQVLEGEVDVRHDIEAQRLFLRARADGRVRVTAQPAEVLRRVAG